MGIKIKKAAFYFVFFAFCIIFGWFFRYELKTETTYIHLTKRKYATTTCNLTGFLAFGNECANQKSNEKGFGT